MKFNKYIITRMRMRVCECVVRRTFLVRLADSSALLTSLLSSVFVTQCTVFSSTMLAQQLARSTRAFCGMLCKSKKLKHFLFALMEI